MNSSRLPLLFRLLAVCCLLSATHLYELFINCLPLSYATGHRSIGMRKVTNQERFARWGAAGGACCFLGGILAALSGSLLTACAWILGIQIHPWVHAAGTVLLIAAIPLILFAGYCLDWAERRREKAVHDPHQRGAAVLAQIAIIATVIGVALLAPAALHALSRGLLSEWSRAPEFKDRLSEGHRHRRTADGKALAHVSQTYE